jgi:hypothetical protein
MAPAGSDGDEAWAAPAAWAVREAWWPVVPGLVAVRLRAGLVPVQASELELELAVGALALGGTRLDVARLGVPRLRTAPAGGAGRPLER